MYSHVYILEGLILDHGIDQIFDPLVPHLEFFFLERFPVAIFQAAGEATRVAAWENSPLLEVTPWWLHVRERAEMKKQEAQRKNGRDSEIAIQRS